MIFKNVEYGKYQIETINPLNIQTSISNSIFTLSEDNKIEEIDIGTEHVVKPGFYSIEEKNNLFNTSLLKENGYFDGYVNRPELADGMIAVKWNKTYNLWQQTTADDPEWYNYIDTKEEQEDNISRR